MVKLFLMAFMVLLSLPSWSADKFNSPDRAILFLVEQITSNADWKNREYGAWIVQDPTNFCFLSTAILVGEEGHIQLPHFLTIKYSEDLIPVAWVHSHPGKSSSGEEYSSQDFYAASTQGETEAILITPTKSVYALDARRQQIRTLQGIPYPELKPWGSLKPVTAKPRPALQLPNIDCEN